MQAWPQLRRDAGAEPPGEFRRGGGHDLVRDAHGGGDHLDEARVAHCLDKSNLTTDKLRELMIASAKMFAEASCHWIGEPLAQQRVQIAQDIARVVRDEMAFGRFTDTIDKRVLDMMSAHGLTSFGHWDARSMSDPEEPFHFN